MTRESPRAGDAPSPAPTSERSAPGAPTRAVPDARTPPLPGAGAPMPAAAHAALAAGVQPDPWVALRRYTPARIALGRTGASQPTQALLAFSQAHALARDAVHEPFAADDVALALRALGFAVVHAHSRAADRTTYLRRPDLGRRLDDASRAALDAAGRAQASPPDVVFVVADGLSAFAATRHAAPLLEAVHAQLAGWTIGPVVVAEQSRVALGDEIGERLGARCVAVLIGERPGLSSPDSLGIYLTWAPHVGCVDAQRNCISNVRPEGLPIDEAAHKLARLLEGARRLQASGIALKDDSEAPGTLAGENGASP